MNTENNVLYICWPLNKNITIGIFDVISTINIDINGSDYVNYECIKYSETHLLDIIINNIIIGVNNNPNQIKINLCTCNIFDYELFQYFMKFVSELEISPSISLIVLKYKHVNHITKILSNYNVTKLVLRNFDRNVVDSIMNIDYHKILKLELQGFQDICTPDKIIVFLNKFTNLKSIVTEGINLNHKVSPEDTVFGVLSIEKIKTDSDDIFLFASQTNNLKKISIDLTKLVYDDYITVEYFENVISTNNNISYIKLIVNWSLGKRVSESTVKKMCRLPLEYINIDGWTIDTADKIDICKCNSNLKHCTFDDGINFINEIPDIVNTNINIESFEFIHSDKNISYLNYVIEILSKIVSANVDNNIKTLKFYSELCNKKLTILPDNIFYLLNKLKYLQLIDIRIITGLKTITINLFNLLNYLINNGTIQTIILNSVTGISDKIFSDTNFFDYNYTLCYIKYIHNDKLVTINNEGFTRNRQMIKNIRFKKIKVLSA